MCEKSNRVKYSVIIPIYNAEKTLKRCIQSLLLQVKNSIEVILVNDGSTDGSAHICRDSMEKKPENVVYIEQTNGGVSSARNRGLDVAKGKFVLFVDSDDYVFDNYFSLIDEAIDQTHADLIQFSYATEVDGKRTMSLYKPFCTLEQATYEEEICKAVCTKTINSPCFKVFRKNIIDNNSIRFDERLSIGEDKLFVLRYALCAHSYAVSGKVAYIVTIDNTKSLSRNVEKDYSQQFRILEDEIKTAVVNAEVSDSFKKKLLQTLNFLNCCGIYHEAKLLHQKKVKWIQRTKKLREKCNVVNDNGWEYPLTLYWRLITFPVRHKMYVVIDMLAWGLVHGIIKRR